MTCFSQKHPSTLLLEGYIAGVHSAGVCVALAAHIELCKSCSSQVADMQESVASQWVKESANGKPGDYSNVVARIVEQDQETETPQRKQIERELQTPDHPVELPRVLAKIAKDGIVWKKLPGGVSQARVNLDDKTRCEFIYMHPGSKTPVHTHTGSEITLVLDGSFKDEMGEYGPADFIMLDKRDQHQPQSDEGCLCFAVLDSPLTFTQGLARLLNPFMHFNFRHETSAH